MYKVLFKPMNIEIMVKEGENLLEIARRAGIAIDSPCNGNMSCGKCKVRIVKGNVNAKGTVHISDEEKAEGIVLACATTIVDDIQVEIPSSSSMYKNSMKIEGLTGGKGKKALSKSKELMKIHNLEMSPQIRKSYIDVMKPTIDDNISDADRIKRAIKKHLGYECCQINLDVIRKLPMLLRECDFNITIVYREISRDIIKVLDIQKGDTTDKLYGVAVDIGTTSVAMCLIDLNNYNILAEVSSANAQIQYGADVINRIIHATRKDGLEVLNKAIVKDTINVLLNELYSKTGISREDTYMMSIAGNTTMVHLLLNVYPDYLRQEPYIPTITSVPLIEANALKIDINTRGDIYVFPSVASYVGGDITSGVLSSGIWATNENVLFIDLGTNGEIVFGNSDFMMTCACSAGPAFEGGGISCGMRASEGAIEKIEIIEGEPELKIINDSNPQGVCGSGIIDLIAQLMYNGIIDRRGKFVEHEGTDRIRYDQHGVGEYIVASKEEFDIEKDISINEVDIDNFIRAKGAIYSGIQTLVESVGFDISCIDKVLVAGGIGSSLDIDNSIAIGMLPDLAKDKFEYIGNSSLTGSCMGLISKDAINKVQDIANQMTYVELSVYPSYMDEFISACFLPHTDIDKFESVKEKLSVYCNR